MHAESRRLLADTHAVLPAAAQDTKFVAKTGASFIFNPMKLDHAYAQMACNDMGGHLAAYTSLEEQVGACVFGVGCSVAA